MAYWQTKHFKALQRSWYAKLAQTGFDDAEEIVGSELELKQFAARPYRSLTPFEITSKESYFIALGAHVQAEVFHSEVDRLILTMFAEGAKIKRITEALQLSGNRRCRMTVRMTIRKYEMEWGMRQYTPRQLNKKVRRTA